MTDQVFEQMIEFKKQEYAGDPEKLIDFLIVFYRSANDALIAQGEEVSRLEKEKKMLEKRLDDLVRVAKGLHGALNNLYEAHLRTWLMGDCHCEAHQRAQTVMLNIALWLHKMKHPNAKLPERSGASLDDLW